MDTTSFKPVLRKSSLKIKKLVWSKQSKGRNLSMGGIFHEQNSCLVSR